MRVQVDETLNEVKLFLPHFNQDTVDEVVKKLKDIEGGELPTDVSASGLHSSQTQTLSVRPIQAPNASAVAPQSDGWTVTSGDSNSHPANPSNSQAAQILVAPQTAQESSSIQIPTVQNTLSTTQHQEAPSQETAESTTDNNIPRTPGSHTAPSVAVQPNPVIPIIDRTSILDFINAQGYSTYSVRKTSVSNYLRSLFDLARLLSQSGINMTAAKEAKQTAARFIYEYIQVLKSEGKYDNLVKKVMEFRLAQNSFDAMGERIDNYVSQSLFSTTDSDIDRQFNVSESKLGSEGIGPQYVDDYSTPDDELAAYIDVIIFAGDTHQLEQLQEWAAVEFHGLKDRHRADILTADQRVKEKYDKIAKDGDPVSELIWNLPYDIVIPTDRDGELFSDHLYVDGTGKARFKLNTWEAAVLAEERQNPDFVCWLRNVDRKPWALCIPYVLDNDDKPKYPDFIIVRKTSNGYQLDVLEPHGSQYTDNLAIAKGLAKYAVNAPQFGRIQLIRLTDGPGNTKTLHRLDMTNSLLRAKVLHANSNEELNSIFNNFAISYR